MTVLEKLQELEEHSSNLIIGQSKLINRMLIALLCDGHLLVEGAPGLAKTRAIKVLADSIEGSFNRLQFTPDLLPADLTGTEIYRPQNGSFEFRKGPLFFEPSLSLSYLDSAHVNYYYGVKSNETNCSDR